MKTAVEWLVDKLENHNGVTRAGFEKCIQDAKEMEKQQMRDAGCPYIGGWEDDEFEYWYNETFKNTEQ